MSNPSELLPDFNTLPEPEEISQIATWLSEAGLESLELSNDTGTRLRIRVAQAAADTAEISSVPACPAEPVAGVGTVAVSAPYFGHLCLDRPMGDGAFAPVGSMVRQDDVVALLTLDTLQVPVRAPVDGKVVEIVATPGALLGYGTEIMTIRPS